MVLKIHAGGKTQDVSGDKAGQGADSISASFYWRYSQEGLGTVKFRGRKEVTRVDNCVFYHCLLCVSARGRGTAHCNQGLEYVLEGHSKSPYPTNDDDA